MDNNSLANAYLTASGLNHEISKLGELGSKFFTNAFEASLVQISNLTSSIVITPELQETVNSLLTTIGSSISENITPTITNTIHDFLRDIPVSSDSSDDDFVIMDHETIKEYEIPETVAIPIGHNRIKIKFDLLITIIGIILSAFIGLKPPASEPEQLALQKTEIQILSQLLENTESTSPKTSEELNALKEAVDELNSRVANIEQSQKEISESGNSDTKNK